MAARRSVAAMATRSLPDRLTEAHRLAQHRIGVETVRAMRHALALLDLDDIDGTTLRWLRVAMPIVQSQSERSARLTAEYLARIRRLEIGEEFAPIVRTPPPTQVATSLTVTGPVEAKALIGRQLLYDEIRRRLFVTVAGSGMRLSLAGGRETMTATLQADRRAVGYARVGSGKPCAWCRMLISRGPVFREDTVDFQAHDKCSCSGRPVYRGGQFDGWTPQGRAMQALWQQAKQQASDEGVGDTFSVFRQLVRAAG